MTVVCLGSGPSLTQPDIDHCRGRASVIAINSTYKNALWADYLYAADRVWWDWNHGAPDFTGKKFSMQPTHLPLYPDVAILRKLGRLEWSSDPWALWSGGGSGGQAINLAVHLGAKRVVLLGCDYKPSAEGRHQHHAPHPPANDQPEGRHLNYPARLKEFDVAVDALLGLGIEVLNATPGSALHAFPHVALRDVL